MLVVFLYSFDQTLNCLTSRKRESYLFMDKGVLLICSLPELGPSNNAVAIIGLILNEIATLFSETRN